MNTKIAQQIQDAQNHGRAKHGSGENDFAHDDSHAPERWHDFIADHNQRAADSTPTDRRQHLIKTAGLCVSAIEAYDRQQGSDASDCSPSFKYATSHRIKFASDEWGEGGNATHLEIEWNGQTLFADITETRIELVGPCFEVERKIANAMNLVVSYPKENDQS